MAGNYQLVASESSIQVLSPTVVADVVVATIQTIPSRVIASFYIGQSDWDASAAPTLLSYYADNIETVMAVPYVLAASPGQTLDASGLLQAELTFTIGYTPKDSPFPPVTVDVPIVADRLYPGSGMAGPDVPGVLSDLNDAYNVLVAAAGGTPPTAPSTPPPPSTTGTPPPSSTPPPQTSPPVPPPTPAV